MMTMMTSFPTLLLLVAQEPFVNSMPTECCAAKTVGPYSYTLVDSPESFPAECKKSCAYTRDGEDGTLYCFAPGNLPVHCKIPPEIFIATYGPFGNLPGQVDTFNDSSQTGHITGLNMWTGKFDDLDVVTGIQMIYGGLPGQAYGDTTGQKKECPTLLLTGDHLQYTKITIYSFDDKQAPISDQNQIYSMKFEVEVDGEVQTQFTCQTGDPSVGNESVIPEPLVTGGKGGKHPGYIVGKVLTGGNGALQSLNFIFNFE